MTPAPHVSVIIPCRNEAKYIGACLDSLLANDYPKERLEILVGDGMSDDGTRGVIKRYADVHSFIHLFDNPRRVTPTALNLGVTRARGSADVPAEVEPLRAHRLSERGKRLAGEPVDLQRLGVVQLREADVVPHRRDHEMAGRVRKPVQDRERAVVDGPAGAGADAEPLAG